MRIDNPVSPEQIVNTHSFGSGLWLPDYHVTDTVSGITGIIGVGTTQLIAGVAGKRIVLLDISIQSTFLLSGPSASVTIQYNINDNNGNIFYQGYDTDGGNSGIGFRYPIHLHYEHGLVTKVAGAPLDFTITQADINGVYVYNVGYTFDS